MKILNFIRSYFYIFMIAFCTLNSKDASAQAANIARGFGDTKIDALNDAKKNAVSQVCGEEVSGNTRRDMTTQNSRVFRSDGYVDKSNISNSTFNDETTISIIGSIKSFKIKIEGEDNGNFFAEIEAIVGECPKPNVIQNAKSSKAILSELREISSQIALLSNNSGVIDHPKAYAEIYHNARIFAQRGEVDKALASYEKLIEYPVQMADPISDLITLGKRIYGINGVKIYFDKKLKGKMPMSSYLYAQILMIEPGEEDNFKYSKFASSDEWIKFAREFPPLAYQILITSKPHSYKYDEQTWSYWRSFYSIYIIVKNSIDEGLFFSYYIDQIRAGSYIEKYSNEGIAKYFHEYFLFYLNDNLGFSDKDHSFYSSFWVKQLLEIDESPVIVQKRIIDIEKSPIVLDFTYYFENPHGGLVQDGGYYNNSKYEYDPDRRGNDLIEISVWDPKVDYKKPFYICTFLKNGKHECVDLNTESYDCNANGFQTEPYKCLYIHEGNFNFALRPNVKGTFSTTELLKSLCISKISYTDGSGKIVEIAADDIIGTYAWPKGRSGNSKIENIIEQCGYQRQYTQSAVLP